MLGVDGLAARGQLVDDAHVEVAVDGHGERTGDGGGRHHQHMGRVVALSPEAGALGHTETVLLVDDHQTETQKLHVVLYHGVGANENLHAAVQEAAEHLLPALAFHDACEQFHVDVHAVEEVTQGGEVLLGQDLGRSHQAHLVAVVDGEEGREQGHEGLP